MYARNHQENWTAGIVAVNHNSLRTTMSANCSVKQQSSRIYQQIVDKYASEKHEEIKALLKPLECELNCNNFDLPENTKNNFESLLQFANKVQDRYEVPSKQ